MLNLLKVKTSSKLFKSFKVNKLIGITKFNFSQTQNVDEIYPSDIIESFTQLSKEGSNNERDWNDMEYHIMDKIHFFDADQFTDICVLASKNTSNISWNLWDLLSRKIFDYELNEFQALALVKAFVDSDHKVGDYAYTPLIRSIVMSKQNTKFEDYCQKIMH